MSFIELDWNKTGLNDSTWLRKLDFVYVYQFLDLTEYTKLPHATKIDWRSRLWCQEI